MANKIAEFMSKKLSAWAIISLHSSLSFLASWTAYNHYQLGNEVAVSFWTMIAALWLGTGIIRLMGDRNGRRN